MRRNVCLAVVTLLVASATIMPQSGPGETARHNELAREIYKELVEIDTTDSTGDITRAAEVMAQRLLRSGFPQSDIQVSGPHPKKHNLVVRYRGTGERSPILLLAHLDVVEVSRTDWSFDPFTLTERDGYFYGRGTADDKAMAAIWVATFIRLKNEGFRPNRDLILALTADEEGGQYNGVEWLLRNHREWIEAGFAVNEGGNGQLREGRPSFLAVQASEKVYQSFVFEVRLPGGHSSQPTRDNPIYVLAEGLLRLNTHVFPVRLNEVTRAYYARLASVYSGQLASDMLAISKTRPNRKAAERLSALAQDNALLRTTCVPTRVEGGNAENALPETARATVNCRILPDESPRQVYETLRNVVRNSRIVIQPVAEAVSSPSSPLRPEVMEPIERTAGEMWPGIPVIPVMSTGATDGLYLRNAGIPTYGVSGLFLDIDGGRIHGTDERIGIRQFYDGREFLYRLVKAYSS